MSFKRSRDGNSSTYFVSDISLPVGQSQEVTAADEREQPKLGVEQLIKQPYNPKKISKQFVGQTIDQSRRPSIFTIESIDSSQPQDVINVRGIRVGLRPERHKGLSDKCFFCKKKFLPSKDIYMYRDEAFCSEECRETQINLDGFTGH